MRDGPGNLPHVERRSSSQDTLADSHPRPNGPAGPASHLVHATPATRTDALHGFALVLGAGGAAGNAWTIGCRRGLGRSRPRHDRGGRCGDWYLIRCHRGSAGAQRHKAGRTARLGVVAPGSIGRTEPERPPALPLATVFERMRAIAAAAASAADLQRAMGAFGLECDAILGRTARQHRAVVAGRLPSHDWPAPAADRPGRRRLYRRFGHFRQRFRR